MKGEKVLEPKMSQIKAHGIRDNYCPNPTFCLVRYIEQASVCNNEEGIESFLRDI